MVGYSIDDGYVVPVLAALPITADSR